MIIQDVRMYRRKKRNSLSINNVSLVASLSYK